MKKMLLILLIFVTLLSGCGKETTLPDTDIGDSQIEENVDNKISIIDLDSNSRPYAVVINNFPTAVKVQTGLSDAYMVYEIPVEGGMSRSLAFFKDKYPTQIGTVRSARHDFLDYIMENDAIFVHFGWSIYAEEQIPKLGIDNIDGNYADKEPFWRENPESLAYEHTAYGNLENIKTYATKKGYRQTTDVSPLLNYSVSGIDLSEKTDSVNANVVKVPYSSSYEVKFVYNEENSNYERYVNNKAHKDYYTNEHYTAKNIIVVKVDYGYTPNNYYLDLYNVGTGEGYYITNGKAVPITWTKADRASKTIYKYKDGTEIEVNDGNTYIMLQSDSKKLTIE